MTAHAAGLAKRPPVRLGGVAPAGTHTARPCRPPHYDGLVTATLEPFTADEIYVVQLETHPRPRARLLLHAALDLWCATSGGLLELTRAGDVVVRRRFDQVEELRIFAGPPESAVPLLQGLRDDLEDLSPEEFREAWGLDAVMSGP